MRWEIKKSVHLFQIVLLVLLILYTGRVVWTQSTQGRNYVYEEQRYTATGASLRKQNRAIAEKYAGHPVDDALFVAFNQDVLDALPLDENGNARFEDWLYGTSLYEYMEFFRTGEDHAVGETFTDTAGMFAGEVPVYAYTDGWDAVNRCLSLLSWTITFGCIVAFSSLFASEYSSGMIALIHPTEHGRGRTVCRKYAVGMLLSAAVYLVLTAGFVLAMLAVFGADGAGADARLLASGKYIALTEHVTCLGLTLLRLLCGLLSCVSAVAMTMAISAFSANPYIAVVASSVVYFAPYLIKTASFSPLSLLPYNICNAFSGAWSDVGSTGFLLTLYILAGLFWCGVSFALCLWGFRRCPQRRRAK